MRKGKSRTRKTRIDIMRANEAKARRKARQQGYDRTRYDKPEGEGTP